MAGETISTASSAIGGLTLLLASFVAYLALKGRLGAYWALATSPAASSTDLPPPSPAPDATATHRTNEPTPTPSWTPVVPVQ